MKGKMLVRDMKLEIKFRLYLRRTLRQTPNRPGPKHTPESKIGPTKLYLINSTSGGGLDGSLTILVAPSSSLPANMTGESVPQDYLLQSHGLTAAAASRNSSLVAVLVIMSLFLIITISTTGLMLVFCRKKNTVFALQKCDQDSEYELDDMEQTDVETCEEDIVVASSSPPRTSHVRSSTCPSFGNVTDSDLSNNESPSRQPLVRRGQGEEAAMRNIIPRSLTINILHNISKDRTCLEGNISDCEQTSDVSLSLLSSVTGLPADMCDTPCFRASRLETLEMGPQHTTCSDFQPSEYSTLLH